MRIYAKRASMAMSSMQELGYNRSDRFRRGLGKEHLKSGNKESNGKYKRFNQGHKRAVTGYKKVII
jgi:hypothetical protein